MLFSHLFKKRIVELILSNIFYHLIRLLDIGVSELDREPVIFNLSIEGQCEKIIITCKFSNPFPYEAKGNQSTKNKTGKSMYYSHRWVDLRQPI